MTYSAAARNHILEPNQSLHVVVLRPKGTTLDVALGGEQGLYVATDRDLTALAKNGELDAKKSIDEVDYEIENHDFAPRLPGQANLVITLTDGDKEQARTLEFLVDNTYIGAVRIGVATVFGGATDRAYEARSVNGSKQSEIVVTKQRRTEIELVLGYSAYLSPRSYSVPSWANFEPYVGIGVLNDGASGLETLKSVHAGIEWEPSANFGVAFTGVVRRVTRLQHGVHVGSPVTGSVPTMEKADWGLGLVFNLSPDFLRIARSSGASFFK